MSCALSMVITAALHEHCTALSQFPFIFLNTNLHEVFLKDIRHSYLGTRQVQSFIVMAATPELHTMWCLYWTHTHTPKVDSPDIRADHSNTRFRK